MLKKTLLFTTAFLILTGSPVFAATDAQIEALASRIQSLEQELALLKREKEVDDEKSEAAAAKQASVEMGKKGLKVTSPDKNYEISLGGYVQMDYRNFLDDKGNTNRDEFTARRIRPVLQGRAGNASFRFMPDFGGGNTRVFDAHVDYKLTDAVQFRAGKFKPPVGLERLQSATDMFFIERGHPTNLVPNRDLGVQVYGYPIPDVLEYQFGVFNGTADLGNADSDPDDKKDVAGRIFAQPFRNSDIVALQGLGLGVGGSRGEHAGSTSSTQLATYRTPGQVSLFTYRTAGGAAYADGTSWRVQPQGYWYYNNFGLLGEYGISSQEVTRNGNHATLRNTAWEVSGSYVLTGEDVNFRGGIKPDSDFGLQGGGWGAWEAVVRTGATDFDDEGFPVYADPDASPTRATSYGAGLNWYLNENFKLQADYDHTAFDGGAAAGQDRPDENALLGRAQFRF